MCCLQGLLPPEQFAVLRAQPSDANSPHLRQLLATHGLGGLIVLLSSHDAAACQQAAWALRNWVHGSCERCAQAATAGAIAPLAGLLRHSLAEVAHQAALAFGNLACSGGGAVCDAIAAADAVAPLVALLSHSSSDVIRAAAGVVANLTAQSAAACHAVAAAGGLPALGSLLGERRFAPGAAEPAAAALRHAAGRDARLKAAIATCAAIPQLVAVLMHPRTGVVENAAWALSNIADGGDALCDAVIAAGGLPTIMALLEHRSDAVVRAAAVTVCGLSAGTGAGAHRRCKRLVAAGAVPALQAVTHHACGACRSAATAALRSLQQAAAAHGNGDQGQAVGGLHPGAPAGLAQGKQEPVVERRLRFTMFDV